MQQDRIRNFSIIAHIDHGKSTLADRILELTGTVSGREMREQVLDSMDLERERGITIKAQAVRVTWKGHQLNLIDTPGHVDFTYEVSRSLQACEGAVIVVDAAQGVEAQTVANAYLAIENDLELLPVANKIDLPQADADRSAKELADLIGGEPGDVLPVSAKTGEGVEAILDAVIERIPPPLGDHDAPPRALIFDSSYDQYRGVVAFVRVVDGVFRKRGRLQAMAQGTRFEAEELGFFAPTMRPADTLEAGEVGYVVTGLKDVSRLRVGDTLTTVENPAAEPLPGYKDVKPMVFAGLFPTDSDDYPDLRDALERLKLNDAALVYEPETSKALGFGFRCGFLGLLHMEIVRERLEREFDLDLLVTAPTVAYRVRTKDGEEIEVHNPADMPAEIEYVEEPYIRASIIVPKEYVGQIMELCTERRGRFDHMEYLSQERVVLIYELPLAEVVVDFYDQLKSRTRGYASFDYDIVGFREGDLVRLDVLIAGESVDALSLILHRGSAYGRGRALVDKLREEIPRQLFDVPVQAAIGSRVIARETIKAKRKDVLAKCYGGDITRKRKLLERQKAGKRRMKQVGAVEVPQEAFLAVLNLDEGALMAAVRHLYVHLPFCAHRCGYCDFVTLVGRQGDHGRYVDAVAAELGLERESLASGLETVFLGGGTPTFTEPDALSRLLRTLPRADEVTVEANPETVTPDLARLLREEGVTRVSLGAQTFSPHLLGVLERRAAPDDVRRAFYHLRGAGFDNISLDLIYGIPGQSAADLDADIDEALALGPEHLSCYELEAKRGTRFTHTHGAELERQAEALEGYFETVVDRLTAAGFRWYETANFCRAPAADGGRDLRSRHNLAYWLGRDYVGLGIGAVSTVDRRRWRNTPRLQAYLEALERGEAPPRELERLGADVQRRERLMLGLRLDEALPLGPVADEVDPAALERLERLGLLTRPLSTEGADTLTLTKHGRLLGGGVTAELLA